MIGIDSNVLLRWIIDDGSSLHQSRQAAEAMENAVVHVSVVTLVEVLWVLRSRYGLSTQARVDFVETLLGTANVVVQHAAAVRSALNDSSTYGGDLPDHLLAALNEEAGCDHTLTFDRKAGRSTKFKRIPEKDP